MTLDRLATQAHQRISICCSTEIGDKRKFQTKLQRTIRLPCHCGVKSGNLTCSPTVCTFRACHGSADLAHKLSKGVPCQRQNRRASISVSTITSGAPSETGLEHTFGDSPNLQIRRADVICQIRHGVCCSARSGVWMWVARSGPQLEQGCSMPAPEQARVCP